MIIGRGIVFANHGDFAAIATLAQLVGGHKPSTTATYDDRMRIIKFIILD